MSIPFIASANFGTGFYATTTNSTLIQPLPISNNQQAIQASYFVGSSTATSTLSGGLNIGHGCISINGICLGVGGSDTQIQYNNNGSFAGSGNLTFDGTNLTDLGNITSGVNFLAGNSYVFTSDPTHSYLTIDGSMNMFLNGDQALNLSTIGGNVNVNPSIGSYFRVISPARSGFGTTTPWATLSVNGTSDLGYSALVGSLIATGTITTAIKGSTQCLHVNSSGVLSGTGSDCGAGGTPGGANTQVQYNDSGVFNGDSTFTFNKTAKTLTVDSISGTTFITTPLLDQIGTITNSSGDVALNLTNGCLNDPTIAGCSLYWMNGGIGIGTSTPSSKLDVNGGFYVETSNPATSTSMTVDFSSNNNVAIAVGTQNIAITFTNSNFVVGKTIFFKVTAPQNGLIGSTTFSGGANSGSIYWDGNVNPGNSVINGTTDVFCFTSAASTTGSVNYNFITADLCGNY